MNIPPLRVRRKKRLITKEDWALLSETIELVLWRAEQRYKEAKRNENSKRRITRTR